MSLNKTIKSALALTITMLSLSTISVTAAFAADNITQLVYDGQSHEYNAKPITLVVNNQIMEDLAMPPIIYQDYTMVPVREVFEVMGAKVEWIQSSQEIHVSYKEDIVVMKIDSNVATVNGNNVTMDVSPKIINGKTMIPLRFVGESLGFVIDWDSANRIVSIMDTETVYGSYGEPAEQTPIDDSEKPETQPEPVNLVATAKDISTEKIISEKHPDTTITGIQTQPDGKLFTIKASSAISSIEKSLLGDNRLIIDIYGSELTAFDLDIAPSAYVSELRVAQNQMEPEKITRIVFELKEGAQFKVSMSLDRKNLYVSFDGATAPTQNAVIKPTGQDLKNITYEQGENTIVISKQGQAISKAAFKENDRYNELIYEINLGGDYSALFGSGDIVVNDDAIKSIEVSNNAQGQTVLTIHENSILAYNITEDAQNIYIQAVHPKEKYARIVVLDAGHGGVDGGTSGDGLNEKDIVFDILNKTIALIEKDPSMKVYSTRTTDVKIPLEDRATFANELGDVFISVHINSAGENTAANGTETYYYTHDNDETVGITSQEVANIMHKHLIEQLGSNDRGVKETDYFVLTHTDIPAVLLEIGFLSNPDEANKLESDLYKQKVANAIYYGLVEVFQQYTPAR